MNADTMNSTSKTDWERIDAMRDEDIDTSDIPPLSEEFWAKAKLRSPRQITASVQIDSECASGNLQRLFAPCDV